MCEGWSQEELKWSRGLTNVTNVERKAEQKLQQRPPQKNCEKLRCNTNRRLNHRINHHHSHFHVECSFAEGLLQAASGWARPHGGIP